MFCAKSLFFFFFSWPAKEPNIIIFHAMHSMFVQAEASESFLQPPESFSSDGKMLGVSDLFLIWTRNVTRVHILVLKHESQRILPYSQLNFCTSIWSKTNLLRSWNSEGMQLEAYSVISIPINITFCCLCTAILL